MQQMVMFVKKQILCGKSTNSSHKHLQHVQYFKSLYVQVYEQFIQMGLLFIQCAHVTCIK
jgi:hypothetical protein